MKTNTMGVWIDGTLYACIAGFAFSLTFLGTDEAAKYISATMLFWMKYGFGLGSAIAQAAKMFRSTVFSDAKRAGNGEGNGHTTIVTQTTSTPETK